MIWIKHNEGWVNHRHYFRKWFASYVPTVIPLSVVHRRAGKDGYHHQFWHPSLCSPHMYSLPIKHDDVIKWKHFPRNWPFVREIHRSPVNFPHKGQWRGALMFSLNYAWINDWVNNREAGDLRRQHGHYDVIVMCSESFVTFMILSRHPIKRGAHNWQCKHVSSNGEIIGLRKPSSRCLLNQCWFISTVYSDKFVI